jgi:hypothetical protein
MPPRQKKNAHHSARLLFKMNSDSQQGASGLVTSQIPPIQARRLRLGSVWLINLLPHCHAGNDKNQHSGQRSQYAHVRLHSFHPDLELLLFGAHSGTGIVKEKLIVFVQCQGAAINQEQN